MKKFKLHFPYRISLIYLVFGALWILFSDKILNSLVTDTEVVAQIQLYKGWFFVFVTSLILFFYVRKDVIRRNQLVKDLQVANKKAQESDDLKTAFLGNLSHYIRTPMNSILGFVELLEQRNVDDEKRIKFYRLINQQSNHLLQFINNIVEVSKIQSGQLPVNKKFFHINKCLNTVSRTILLELEEKKNNIHVFVDNALPDGNDVLFSDEEKIKHILYNLMENAIHATENGEIVVGYSIDRDQVMFYVRDTGCGVPQYAIDYIFKGFVFTLPTEIKKSDGFGIGLYLSAGLVKLLGGKLELRYTGKEGSEFCFNIPNEQ